MCFANQARFYYINDQGKEQMATKKTPIARGIFKR